MPKTRWFEPNIAYQLTCVDTQDSRGGMLQNDFPSYGALKKGVKNVLAEFTCPSCGSRKVTGRDVIVKYGKVHLYEQIAKPGWFGSVKYKDKFVKTVWRVNEVVLQQKSGFLMFGDAEGEIKCMARGCSWQERGGRAESNVAWVPIKDIPSYFGNVLRGG